MSIREGFNEIWKTFKTGKGYEQRLRESRRAYEEHKYGDRMRRHAENREKRKKEEQRKLMEKKRKDLQTKIKQDLARKKREDKKKQEKEEKKFTKTISPKGSKIDDMSFGEAFKSSKSAGKKEFTWRGNKYHTRTKEEEASKKFEEGGEVQRHQAPSFGSMFDVGSKMKLKFGGGAASERAKMRHERKMARQGARADRKMVRTEGRQERKGDRLAGRQEAGSRRQDRKDRRLDSRLGYYEEGGKTQIRKTKEGEEFEKISRKDRRKLKRRAQVRTKTKPNDPEVKVKRTSRRDLRRNDPGFKNLPESQKRKMTGYETEHLSDYIGDKKRIDASIRKRFIGMKNDESRKNLRGRTVHQVLPEGVVSKRRERHTEKNPGLLEENIAKGRHLYAYPENKAVGDPNIGVYETKESQEKRKKAREDKELIDDGKDPYTGTVNPETGKTYTKDEAKEANIKRNQRRRDNTREPKRETEAIDDTLRDSIGTFPGTREDTMDFEEGSGPEQNIPKNVDAYRRRRYVFNPKTGVYTEKEKRKSGLGYKKTGREYADEEYIQAAKEKKDIRERKESKEPTRQEKKEKRKQDRKDKRERIEAQHAELERQDAERRKKILEERRNKKKNKKGNVPDSTDNEYRGGGTLMSRYNKKYNTGGVNLGGDDDNDKIPNSVDADAANPPMIGPTMPPNNNQMSISGNNLGEIKDPLANDEPEPDNLFEEDVNIDNTSQTQDQTNQGDMNQQDDSMDQGGMDQGQEPAGPTRAQLRHERKMARQQARADRRMVRTEARQQRKADRLAGRMDKRARRQDRKDQRQEARISKREDRRAERQSRKFDRQQNRNMRRRNRRGNFHEGGMVKGKKGAGLGIVIVVGRKSNKKGK